MPAHNRYLEARERGLASPWGARRSPNGSYLRRTIARPIDGSAEANVVVSGRLSNGNGLLFEPGEWKRISASRDCGAALFFAVIRPCPAQDNQAWSNDLKGLSGEIKLLGKDWWAHQGEPGAR